MRTAVPLVVIGALALAGWRLRSRRRASAADEKRADAMGDALFGWCFFLRQPRIERRTFTCRSPLASPLN